MLKGPFLQEKLPLEIKERLHYFIGASYYLLGDVERHENRERSIFLT